MNTPPSKKRKITQHLASPIIWLQKSENGITNSGSDSDSISMISTKKRSRNEGRDLTMNGRRYTLGWKLLDLMANAKKSSSNQSTTNTAPKTMNKDCMHHGDMRHVCQFIVNKLACRGLLKGKSRVRFSNDICACHEQFDFNKHFKDEDDAKSYVEASKQAIHIWEGVPHTINKVLAELDKEKNISEAILRFVYYFKKACNGDYKCNTASSKSRKLRKANTAKKGNDE